MNVKALGLAGVAVALCAAPAVAHHSFAMFDGDRMVTLAGTVKEFQWTNPHSWILMMVPDEQGQPQQWAIELESPGGLARKGWLPKSLTPGMKVTAVIRPLKDGTHGGEFLSLTFADGTVLPGSAPTAAPATPATP